MQSGQDQPPLSTAQIVTICAWALLAIILNHWITWAILVFLALGVIARLVTHSQQPPAQQPSKPTPTVRVHMTVTKPTRSEQRLLTLQEARQVLVTAMAHHGLASWWETAYSQEERAAIVTRLTETRVGPAAARSSHSTAAEFLANLAQDFKRSDRVHLGIPMLEKALTYNLNPQDEYYTLAGYIEQRYKQRSDDPSAIDDVIKACERTIELIPALHTHWKAQHKRMEAKSRRLAEQMGTPHEPTEWEGFPPSHVGFPRLIAIRKKQKDKEEVSRLQQLYEDIWLRHSTAHRRIEAGA